MGWRTDGPARKKRKKTRLRVNETQVTIKEVKTSIDLQNKTGGNRAEDKEHKKQGNPEKSQKHETNSQTVTVECQGQVFSYSTGYDMGMLIYIRYEPLKNVFSILMSSGSSAFPRIWMKTHKWELRVCSLKFLLKLKLVLSLCVIHFQTITPAALMWCWMEMRMKTGWAYTDLGLWCQSRNQSGWLSEAVKLNKVIGLFFRSVFFLPTITSC